MRSVRTPNLLSLAEFHSCGHQQRSFPEAPSFYVFVDHLKKHAFHVGFFAAFPHGESFQVVAPLQAAGLRPFTPSHTRSLRCTATATSTHWNLRSLSWQRRTDLESHALGGERDSAGSNESIEWEHAVKRGSSGVPHPTAECVRAATTVFHALA